MDYPLAGGGGKKGGHGKSGVLSLIISIATLVAAIFVPPLLGLQAGSFAAKLLPGSVSLIERKRP